MRADLLRVFREDMAYHPRSLQVALGPSELGDPCERKIAYKVSGDKPNTMGLPAWIGTQAHAGAQAAFEADNARLGRTRWLTEQRVHVGEVCGMPVDGTCDLFDTDTGTVVDFKFVGASTLKNVRANGVSPLYKTQTQCYGLGMSQSHDVQEVGVLYVPRDGHLNSALYVSEPYDADVAHAALDRLARIMTGIAEHGDPLRFPTGDSYCTFCPFYAKGSTDPRATCPGHGYEAMTLSFTQ